MLIAAKKKSDVLKLKKLLSSEFDMKDLGAAKKILGMEIYRDHGRKKFGTADNPADMFTKPVPVRKFKHCLDLLNVDSHI